MAHLHKAAELLKKYEGKEWQQVIPDGNFPQLLTLGENKEYVRKVLGETVQLTSIKDEYTDVAKVPAESEFFTFQNIVNKDVECIYT